jgi:diadenosine tetraphosphate (Ap4A) HIT family hydrolase
VSTVPTRNRFSHLVQPTGAKKRLWDTILLGSNNFLVVPSLGSIVPGWVLLVPKRSVLSFAQLSDNEITEAKSLVIEIQSFLRDTFGPVTTFEHGAGDSGSVIGCGLDQAHLHLVPLEVDLFSEVQRDKLVNWELITGWSNLNKVMDNSADYLFVSEDSGKAIVAKDFPPTSQYFRKHIAKLSGIESAWDYRTNAFRKNIACTVTAFSNKSWC